MLNRLIGLKKPEDEKYARGFQPSSMDSSNVRITLRQSVLVLSVLLSFGNLIHMIDRNETHVSIYLSFGVSLIALVVASQVAASSRHLMTALNAVIVAMLLNIHIQVLHGISALIVWSIPFYLIWILIYPTLLVLIVGILLSGTFIHFASDHPVIGPNWMLALATAVVAHFAKLALREQLQLAASDSLTGALNRRYLVAKLASTRAEFLRSERMSSLVLMDVDGLKAINDSFGHQVGDAVLASFAMTVRERIRGSDALFRIGGDEFVLILGDAKASAALKVANDVRQLFREQPPKGLPDFAISFGICCVDDSSSADDWLARADEALYEAKNQGGDTARMAT
jgi:diguanylate cyclase (GGDEF)-like protein